MISADLTERYSRHTRLPGFGDAAQVQLAQARVLIIGLGGLGSPASLYLAAAGVGQLVLSDFDCVDASNLQRQIVHREASVGEAKVLSAQAELARLNSSIDIAVIDHQLDGEELQKEVQQADLVLDCTDNFATRFALNAACVKAKTPLVSGAAIRFQGQLCSFDPRRADSPCYHCLYADESSLAESCEQLGVLSPVVGVIGTLQALEAIKLLTGLGDTLVGKLLLFDGLRGSFQTMQLPRDPHCAVCGRG
jgi:adenylyltransferase/sulfurtransferase